MLLASAFARSVTEVCASTSPDATRVKPWGVRGAPGCPVLRADGSWSARQPAPTTSTAARAMRPVDYV